MPATVFYRKDQSPREQNGLHRSDAGQLRFLLELIGLSLRLNGGKPLKQDPKRLIWNKKMEVKVDIFQEEIQQFFIALNRHQCRFLLVGGFAVNVHGYSRATGDLDLWLADTTDNRQKLVAAAHECGVAGAEHLLTMEWVPGWSGFALESGFEVELMSYVAGFTPDDFEVCYRQAKQIEFETVPVRIMHLNDLIAAKKAVNRPKDQEDIRQLEEIRRHVSDES